MYLTRFHSDNVSNRQLSRLFRLNFQVWMVSFVRPLESLKWICLEQRFRLIVDQMEAVVVDTNVYVQIALDWL
jgi:hypothetical protein